MVTCERIFSFRTMIVVNLVKIQLNLLIFGTLYLHINFDGYRILNFYLVSPWTCTVQLYFQEKADEDDKFSVLREYTEALLIFIF